MSVARLSPDEVVERLKAVNPAMANSDDLRQRIQHAMLLITAAGGEIVDRDPLDQVEDGERLLTPEEAADHLGITPTQLGQLMAQRKIAVFPRFTVKALDLWVQFNSRNHRRLKEDPEATP